MKGSDLNQARLTSTRADVDNVQGVATVKPILLVRDIAERTIAISITVRGSVVVRYKET